MYGSCQYHANVRKGAYFSLSKPNSRLCIANCRCNSQQFQRGTVRDFRQMRALQHLLKRAKSISSKVRVATHDLCMMATQQNSNPYDTEACIRKDLYLIMYQDSTVQVAVYACSNQQRVSCRRRALPLFCVPGSVIEDIQEIKRSDDVFAIVSAT